MSITANNRMQRKRVLLYLIALSIFALLSNIAYWNMRKLKQKVETNLARGPTKGFVITMDNETGWRVAEKLKEAFEIEDMQVVVGSAGNYSQLPLYNRYLTHHGRTDTLQIGNLNMLGCMQSHREVWTRIQEDSYVFEHDANPADNALQTVKRLLAENSHLPWSVINLERPSAFVDGTDPQYTAIGSISRTCRHCISYGNRGYLITKQAARILLDNYEPPVVQADAYMSLLNSYHPKFKKIWTTVQAVDWIPQPSTVQVSFEFISVVLTIRNFINPHND